jgi:hypothetical protein
MTEGGVEGKGTLVEVDSVSDTTMPPHSTARTDERTLIFQQEYLSQSACLNLVD